MPALDEEIRREWHHDVDLPQILSMDRSGYTREAAVLRLGEIHDGSELPFLLLRLNDWVPQVREAARAAVFDRVRAEYLEPFVRSLALVRRLERTGRADHAELFARLSDLFASNRSLLLREMAHAPRHDARLIARLLLTHPSPDVIEAALAQEDDLIRLWAMRHVNDEATLERLAADPSPAVRKEALLALPHIAEGALLDRSASVREIARLLLQRSREEYAAIYRNAAMLMGLAEVGNASDADFAASFLSHPRPRVRRDAVRCIARLGNESFVERLTPMLDDPSPAVSAAVRNFLRKHAGSVDATQLTGFRNAHAQRNAIQVMAALPKWQSIISLLRAGAHEHVRRWIKDYNRSQTPPTARELEELRLALEDSFLDTRDAKEIRFVIGSFGGSA